MKKLKIIAIVASLILVLCIGVTVCMAYLYKVDLPLLKFSDNDTEYSRVNELMGQWSSVQTYTSGQQTVTEELIEETPTPQPAEQTAQIEYIDMATLQTYLNNTGYTGDVANLAFDLADKNNTPTGVKTIYGDEVLAVDRPNGVIIVGIDVEGTKCKLAIIDNSKQVGMSIVPDLGTWQEANWHSQEEGALLVVNANDYDYDEKRKSGSLTGIAMRHGQLIRKSSNDELLVGITQEGEILFGELEQDMLYDAAEATKIYTGLNTAGNVGSVTTTPDVLGDAGGEVGYTASPTPSITVEVSNTPSIDVEGTPSTTPSTQVSNKMARTAIATTYEGKVLILVAEGGDADQDKGITENNMLLILGRYGATTGAAMSYGHKVIMYWNGREINETYGYRGSGLRLPNAIVVRPSSNIG